MLYEEAQWVGNKIKTYFSSGERILNLGSSTSYVREIAQPHMTEFIFTPAHKIQIDIKHVDISTGEGVDIVGDLTDPSFLLQLKSMDPRGILCCNLLEHLEDRVPILNSLKELTSVGDILILTVPFQYPYHLDPIDTLYRPSLEELTKVLPNFHLIEGEELKARRYLRKNDNIQFQQNYFQQLTWDPKLFLKLFLRCLLPFYKPKKWFITLNDLAHMFHPFKVTCAVLKRMD